VNGYERVLSPSLVEMVPDVWFHLNNEQSSAAYTPESSKSPLPGGHGRERKPVTATINTAIEATPLGSQMVGFKMCSFDAFIQENIRRDDVLEVSVGGNDTDADLSATCAG
jgi:hypothetical protein